MSEALLALTQSAGDAVRIYRAASSLRRLVDAQRTHLSHYSSNVTVLSEFMKKFWQHHKPTGSFDTTFTYANTMLWDAWTFIADGKVFSIAMHPAMLGTDSLSYYCWRVSSILLEFEDIEKHLMEGCTCAMAPRPLPPDEVLPAGFTISYTGTSNTPASITVPSTGAVVFNGTIVSVSGHSITYKIS
jgi:hypothetical protein